MNDKSYIGSNLKFLRKKTNCTQDELSKRLEIGRHSIGSYEEGRAEPKIDTLFQMADLFKIPAEAIVKRDLSQLTDAEFAALNGEYNDIEGKNLRVLSIPVDSDGRERITLVNQKAAAGYLNGYGDPEYYNTLPNFDLPLPVFLNGTFRAFEVSGDSMLPIKSGSVVVCSFVENFYDVKDDEIYVVVSLNEGVVLKRLKNRLTRDGKGKFILKSDNPTFPPREVEVSDIKEIWKVKALISQEFPDPDMSLERLSTIVMELQQEVIRMKK